MPTAQVAGLLPRGLAFRVAVAFALLALSLVLVLGVTVRNTANVLLDDQTRLMLTQLAASTRDRLERRMAAFARDIQDRAQAEVVENPNGRSAYRRRAMAQLQTARPEFSWIGFTRPDGIVTEASGGILEGVNVAARPWFQRALRGLPLTDVHEAKLLQSLLGAPGGEPLRFVDIAYPLRDEAGRLTGVLGAHVSWEFARLMIRDTLQLHYRVRGLEILIYDAQGAVLLGPADEGRLEASLIPRVQDANEVVFIESAGTSGHVVAFSATRGTRDIESLGWIVAVRQDIQNAQAPLRRLDRQLLLWGPVAILLFALAGVALSRWLVRPLEALTDTAARLARGEHGAAFPADDGVAEVGHLAVALRNMVENLTTKERALRDANTSLEQRVRTRTVELATSEAQLRLILDNMPTVVCEVDLEGRIRFANRQYHDFYGLGNQSATGRRIGDIAGVDAQDRYLACVPALRQGQSLVYEKAVRLPDWREVHIEVHIVPGRSASGEVDRAYAMISDITARKQVEAMLTQQAVTDTLTGLPNRRLLMDRLQQAMAQAERNSHGLAVLYLDLDGFKAVNDHQGHAAGDELLKLVAARLSASVRAGDTVARLGGDEFVVLLDPCDAIHDAEAVAVKLIAALESPFTLRNRPVGVSASIGISLFPEDGSDPTGLLAYADRGLYAAKSAGKRRHARVVS